jgi:hypothetical protein
VILSCPERYVNGHVRNAKWTCYKCEVEVNIQNQILYNYVCLTVGGVEVVGQSGGVLNEGDPKDGDTCPPGGDPHGIDISQYL